MEPSNWRMSRSGRNDVGSWPRATRAWHSIPRWTDAPARPIGGRIVRVAVTRQALVRAKVGYGARTLGVSSAKPVEPSTSSKHRPVVARRDGVCSITSRRPRPVTTTVSTRPRSDLERSQTIFLPRFRSTVTQTLTLPKGSQTLPVIRPPQRGRSLLTAAASLQFEAARFDWAARFNSGAKRGGLPQGRGRSKFKVPGSMSMYLEP